MKLFINSGVTLLLLMLLSGCLYPEANLENNQIPLENQVSDVQEAVVNYQKDQQGLLPIKTREASTPIYQKYPIDFNKLVPRYLSETPGTAYESGGLFSYVLVDVETNPMVKLLDLRIAEQIRELNTRLMFYRQSNGYPPYKEVVDEGVFTLDYAKLGYEEPPFVVSPFSGLNLPLIIASDTEVYVDYKIDLFKVLQEEDYSFNQDEDIRHILVDQSIFVPAYSMPYTIDPKNGEPIFLYK
ncbi:hypothetical protein V1503_17120 [Bacillus sp. SCS-151]|uniref:hypothetical protein n=1 Tax=Nanhaiella sioensis TaxID=3115293 RepID=UPI0039788205